MTSINELMASGSKAHKWDDADECAGLVVDVKQTQQTDLKTGEPKTWSNGDPMMQWVFTLKVAEPTSEDDGLRALYAKGGKYEVAKGQGTSMLDAIFGAYRTAGVTELEGAYLRVKRTGEGVAKARGFNPPNLFSALVEKPTTPVPAAGNPNPFG